MEKRFFTVAEARGLLPSLKKLVGQVVVLSGRLEEYRDIVQLLADSASHNSGSPEGTAYFENLIVLQNYLVEVQETGCLVKSLREGLVDFPHLKDGREVYLCWRFGEEDIHFWHETDAGVGGRTPLLE